MAVKTINLPSLRGVFGNWSYFSTIIKVKDIVNNKRIITVPESEELYTTNINQVLQREIDASRITKIKDYLLKNKERFFSSLIVAIHKGNPIWSDFDLERHFRVNNRLIEEKEIEFIENKVGVLTLSGNEEIFVLDGQHRLLGIRKAFEENNDIVEDEVSLLFIIHNSDLKERTRRLFTVLNRYAVSIKPAEKVILEEDDAAAILTRRLVQNHPIFLKDHAVSTSRLFNLSSNDTKNFTTLVCLYEINKILIDFNSLYRSKVIIRPTDELLNSYYEKILSFWNFLFKKFPLVVSFINEEKVPSKFVRNKESGGNLLLRPEGQQLIAYIYKEFEEANKIKTFKNNINKIDFDLSGKNWKYVFWKGENIISKHKKLKKAILKYLLGKKEEKSFIFSEMTKIYKESNLKYKLNIHPVVG